MKTDENDIWEKGKIYDSHGSPFMFCSMSKKKKRVIVNFLEFSSLTLDVEF